MYSLIHALKGVTKSKEKEAIVKSFFECCHANDIAILKMYLDPLYVLGFSSKMFEKTLQAIDEHWNNPMMSELTDNVFDSPRDVLAKLPELSGNAAINYLASAMVNMPPESVEVLRVVISKETIGVDLGIVNKAHMKWANTNLIDVFECQLADKYIPERFSKYGIDKFYASRKMDGLRAVYRKDGDSYKLMSRNNKPHKGFEGIELELEPLKNEIEAIEGHPILIDGELFSDSKSFSEIQGAISRDSDDVLKEDIKFNVFAIAYNDNKETSTEKMLELLNRLKLSVQSCPHSRIKIVEYLELPNDPEMIKSKCIDFVVEGWEGIMLRHPEIGYSNGRSKNLLKFKLFKESDFKITGIEIGEGKFSNTMGNINIAGIVDEKEIRCDVGSGFNDATRNYIWENKESMIGKTVEIKYQEITKSEGKEYYSLRFPIFRKFKEDR